MKETLVSIVLLTKNAGKEFVRTLEAISRQDVDFPFEIIVLDSGSTDGTLELSGKYDARIYRIPPAEFNFGLTRNHGFSLASGDFIVTISQDAVPFDKSWLEKMVSPFLTDKNVVAVQGKTVVPGKPDVFYWEKKGFFYFTSESRNWIEKYKCGLSFVNCAVRRDFWEIHQLGSIPFSEDKVFQKMIHDSGMDIHVAKDAICFHGHQYSFKSLFDRLKNEGVGWRTAGVRYGLKDCLSDIYDNKWMIRNGFGGWMKGEIQTTQELLFPILRPVCICWGNSKPI